MPMSSITDTESRYITAAVAATAAFPPMLRSSALTRNMKRAPAVLISSSDEPL